MSKVEKFDAFLAEKEIPWFEKLEQKDELNTVLYRGNIEAAGQNFPVLVVLDDSIFTLVRTVITPAAVKEERRAEVTALLNELNGSYKIFKYYIDPNDNRIYMDISVPATAENFDEELVLYIISQVALPHLEEFYPSIMDKIWDKK